MKAFEAPELKNRIFAAKDILTASADEDPTEKPTEKPEIIPITPGDDFE